jgi:nicotinamidase-related amidase
METRPYAWPYDGRLTTADFAFAVVTGLSSGSSGEPPESLIAACTEFAEQIRERGARVVWIACSGSEPPVQTQSGDLVVEAPTAMAFIASDLDLVLRSAGIERMAIGGWPLEIAVHSTLRRANDLGYECLLLEDLTAPLDPILQPSAISQILMSGGIFGAVGDSAELLKAFDAAASEQPEGVTA